MCRLAAVMAWGLFVTCLAVGGQAWAEPQATEPQTAAERTLAISHYDAGTAAFHRGDYKKAVEEYSASYELWSQPLLLYNIARAYHLAEKPEKAIHYYRLYLELGVDTSIRAEAEQFLAELVESAGADGEGGDGPAEHAPTLESTARRGDAPAEAASPPEHVTRTSRADSAVDTYAGWGLVGVGAILGGLSAKYAWDARQAEKDLEGWDERWPDNLRARVRAGERASKRAVWLGASAGVATAVGVGLLLWRPFSDRAVVQVSAGGQGGGSLSFAATF